MTDTTAPTASDFDRCYQATVEDPQVEGGYVLTEHPEDPGGRTFAGIAYRYHPQWAGWRLLDPEDLGNADTLRHARNGQPASALVALVRHFYLNTFWHPIKGDHLPLPLAYNVFDMAVNAGPGDAVRTLQTTLGTVWVDGLVGPHTLKAISATPPQDYARLIAHYNALRLRHYTTRTPAPTWAAFGRGWANRVAHFTMLSLQALPAAQPAQPTNPSGARTA